jgi:hypothetical protein
VRPGEVSRVEKLLAAIMTGGRGGGQMHGLVGKSLLYASAAHVDFLSLAMRPIHTDPLALGILRACSFHWASFFSDMIRVLCRASLRT